MTPLPAELPQFASTEALEAEAASIEIGQRRLFGVDDQGVRGWTMPLDRRPAGAFPVFAFDGTLLGIFVSGYDIVPRDVYEAPAFDAEPLARARLGDERYDEAMAFRECVDAYVRRVGELPDFENLVC